MGSKKIRVLVLSHMYPSSSDPLSGIWVHEQLRALTAIKGCEIRVVSPRPFCPAALGIFKNKWEKYARTPFSDVIDGVPVLYPRYPVLPGKAFSALSPFSMHLWLRKLLTNLSLEFGPDILHSHAAVPDGFAGVKTAEALGIPCVCTFHGSDINRYPYYNRLCMELVRYVISGTDRIFAVSGALKKRAEQLAKPKNPVLPIYNGCDTSVFKYDGENRSQKRKDLGIPQDASVMCFAGHLIKEKGIFELLGSFEQLSEKFEGLHLMIIGEGPSHMKLEKEVLRLNSRARVHLVGQIAHNEMSLYLSASDIFVLPSYNEGLPVSIIEAMACALPVISTNVGGISEIVTNGVSGVITDVKNVGLLTKAIEKLLKDPGLMKQFGSAGRAIVEKRFSWERSANNLYNAYIETMDLSKQ